MNLFKNQNSKYGLTDKIAIVRKVLKRSINVGEAVVDILGNTGIAGFKFHVPQTEQVRLECDITDQYTDINTPIQDHIAHKPITITLTGLVGDYFYSNNKIEDYIAMITPTLKLVEEFMNQENPIVKQVKTKWDNGWNDFINSTPKPLKVDYSDKRATPLLESQTEENRFLFNGLDVFSIFQQLYKLKSAQTRAFLFFEALWRAGERISVETTWKRYDNMVIQMVEPKRDNNADITEFTITVKQINTTESIVETPEQYANRYKQLISSPIDKGQIKGEKVSILDGVEYA